VELIRRDLIERQLDAQFQPGAKIECPAQELTGFRRLRRIQPVERAVVATAATLWGIGAERRIA